MPGAHRHAGWLVGSLVAVLLGCRPGAPAASGGATEASETTSSETTSSATTPTTLGPTSTTTGASGPTESSSGDGSGQTFIDESDAGDSGVCDNWAQDCPPGEKCSAYADGRNFWNSAKCVPVMDDPAQVGEPCFVVDSNVSGIDNCELGAYCWDVDAENKGTCIGLCTGSPGEPQCEPGSVCEIGADGWLNLCFPGCDPLAQDCGPGAKCTAYPIGDGFYCEFDVPSVKGETHDYCQYRNVCNIGLACVESTAAVECDKNYNHCCEPFCDLAAPNTCPGQGQVCAPYFDAGLVVPPKYQNLGACAVPG